MDFMIRPSVIQLVPAKEVEESSRNKSLLSVMSETETKPERLSCSFTAMSYFGSPERQSHERISTNLYNFRTPERSSCEIISRQYRSPNQSFFGSPSSDSGMSSGYWSANSSPDHFSRTSPDNNHSKFVKNSSNNIDLKGRARGRPRRDEIVCNPLHKHVCEVCGRSFAHAKGLRTHSDTHNGIKKFQCEFPGCGKRFVQSGHRKTHFRIHTNENPFVCPILSCGNRYKHSNRKCIVHRQLVIKEENMPEISSQMSPLQNTPEKDMTRIEMLLKASDIVNHDESPLNLSIR